MYYKINNNNVKVSIPQNIIVPKSLEDDINKIATDFKVTCIREINVVKYNTDFLGMSVGEYKNNEKYSTISLTTQLLDFSKTKPALYYECLAHEIQHSLNFEIFSSRIDYAKYLNLKNHIRTTNDLFFCYGVTFFDEYLAYLKGREYSPAVMSLKAFDFSGNDIYIRSSKFVKLAINIFKNPSYGKCIFLQYQKNFEIFIIDIIRLLSHKSPPTYMEAIEIETKLKDNKLIARYIEQIENQLNHLYSTYPECLSDDMCVDFGKTLFGIFDLVNVNINDDNGYYQFVRKVSTKPNIFWGK